MAALSAALPARFVAVPYVAAGLGLHPDELFGLEVGDVDLTTARGAAVDAYLGGAADSLRTVDAWPQVRGIPLTYPT